MKNKNFVAIYLLSLFALLSCGDDRTQEFFDLTKENQWIYSTMRQEYLWSDKIKPQERSKFFVSASNFFNSLLYKDDNSSFFTDSVYSGDYGLTFTLMRDPILEVPNRVYALVLYVEPGSPAAIAGIRRGTWISAVNGKKLSTSSSSVLTSGENVQLATEYIEYDDMEDRRYWVQDDTVAVSASVPYEMTDIHIDSVYSVRDRNVGYLLCNSLNDDDFIDRINSISERFISRNVTDIVVDLRYNNGGSIANAAYLASLLVPSSLIGTPFCTLKKNDNVVDTLYNYVSTEYTLSDKRVFFITGEATKGVAELLVASVDASRAAYDVMTVGGKSAGSNVMVESHASPYGFSINPATAYAYSSDGKIVSAGGIKPDYELNDLEQIEQQIYPLGDEREYLLYSITYIITNGTLPANSSAAPGYRISVPYRCDYIR